MARATSPSFVTEVELLTTGKQAKKLRSKFEAARQVYNAVLGEALKRLRAMRRHPSYRWAKIEENKKRRNELFAEAQKAVEFDDYALKAWARQFNHTWINGHIKSKTVEATAGVAFKTAQLKQFEPRRRVKFRRKGELRAVEGRTDSDCHWKGDHIKWVGLNVPATIDLDDPVVAHGLSCPARYVRMVRRIVRGRERFFAQLLCKGDPYRKESHRPGRGVVGVDVGPSTIAVVGDGDGELQAFKRDICAELASREKRIACLQRAMDASRRATNPQNFDEKGRVRPFNERSPWKFSDNYRQLVLQLAAEHQRMAAHRKNIHGQLAAKILKAGDVVRLEDITYKAWHKRKTDKKTGHRKKSYGRSMGIHAPAMLQSRIESEAAKWGATVEEVSTYKTKLTQTCHCGDQKKKALSERVHRCDKCGAEADRDLHSAYMARYAVNNEVQVDQANEDWPTFCATLGAAWTSEVRSRSRKNRPKTKRKVRCERAGKTATPHFLEAGSDRSSSGETSCDRSVGDQPGL